MLLPINSTSGPDDLLIPMFLSKAESLRLEPLTFCKKKINSNDKKKHTEDDVISRK